MKFVEYSFPELEDAARFNKEDNATLIDEIANLTIYKNDLLQVLLEKKVLEIYEKHAKYIPHVEKVIVDANYEYNDEGYQLKNAMIWINNWEDPSMGSNYPNATEFQKDLDLSLEQLSPLLTRASEMNIHELVDKFALNEKKHEIKPEEQQRLNGLEKNKSDFSTQAAIARSEEAQGEMKKTKKHYKL